MSTPEISHLRPVQQPAAMIQRARDGFPSLRELTYLNSGSYGLLADSVSSAVQDYLNLRIARGADWPTWVAKSESLQRKLARLLSAQPAEVAITASASAGINAVASAMTFPTGRERVVLSDYEFPTSGQIWFAQEKRGAIVKRVKENSEGRIPLESFREAIDERTRVVAVSQVCFRHGGGFSSEEIAEISEIAHRNGALLILDSYQAVGAVPLDVRTLGADFVVGGMCKYLLGTAGIGFLYARQDVIPDLVPTASGWFAQEEGRELDTFGNHPSSTATRFQAGTPPIINCYAAEAGLDIILELGVEAIWEKVRSVVEYGIHRFKDDGLSIATPSASPPRGPMVAVRACDDEALVADLLRKKIVTSSRDGNVRFGIHFYNEMSDIDVVADALVELRSHVA